METIFINSKQFKGRLIRMSSNELGHNNFTEENALRHKGMYFDVCECFNERVNAQNYEVFAARTKKNDTMTFFCLERPAKEKEISFAYHLVVSILKIPEISWYDFSVKEKGVSVKAEINTDKYAEYEYDIEID